jgi:plasmid stabilization system protein ParE
VVNSGYVLTVSAAHDIREIGDWSLERWGNKKTVHYLKELHEGMNHLAENVKIFQNNKTWEALSGDTELFLYPINKHYIVYLPLNDNTIPIAAVIRQGRDIPSILQKNQFAIRGELKEIKDKIAQGLDSVPPITSH